MDRKEKEKLLLLLREKKKRESTRNEIYEVYRKFKGRYAVLIGGSGSGKSYEIADKHIDRIVREDGHRILCSRAEQKQISESQVPLIVSRIKTRYAESFASNEWKINLSKGHESITYLPNGNTFIFWGLDDPDKLKSIFDITSAWLEEADQIDASALREIDRRLRGYQGMNKNGTEKYMQISFSFNPVHESCWIKPRFFDVKDTNQLMLCGKQGFDDCIYYKDFKVPDLTEKIKIYDEMLHKDIDRYKYDTLVLHSTYLDNKFIDDTYSQNLLKNKESEPEEYNVYALGQWGVYGARFFKEFNRKIHVCEPFKIPDYWNKYMTLDYGLDMLACYWVAIDTEFNAYVYKELYQSDLIISAAAKEIKKVNGKDKTRIRYAPPDLGNRRQETGKSVFDIFSEHKIHLTKSSNRRVDGWLAVKEWLKVIDTKDIETGEPIKTTKLKIFSNCTNLIRCIPQVQQSETDPNDVATEPHEFTHSLDALRGFCVMRQRPSDKEESKKIQCWALADDPVIHEGYTSVSEVTSKYLGGW